VGARNGEIYNGADDDGSGTVALLEIAQAFQMEKKQEMVLKDLSFFFMLLAKNTAYMVLVIILKIHCFPLPIL
jgi:Zn-dependent M28 family amino/carboxypeptidase